MKTFKNWLVSSKNRLILGRGRTWMCRRQSLWSAGGTFRCPGRPCRGSVACG